MALNDAGQVAFTAKLEVGPGGVTADTNAGIWGPDGSGGFTLLLREGDPVPGTVPASTITEFGRIRAFSNAGHVVAENMDLGASPTAYALFRAAPGAAPALLAGTGTPIPGAAGAQLSYTGIGGAVDDTGRFITAARLQTGPGGVTDDDDDVILEIAPDGAVSAIAREGGPAPAPAGAVFEDVGRPVYANGSGLASYFGRLEIGPGGVTAGDDRAHYLNHPGGSLELVGTGSLAPDLPGGVTPDSAVISDFAPSGAYAFRNGSKVYGPKPGGGFWPVPYHPGSSREVRGLYTNSLGDVALGIHSDDPLDSVPEAIVLAAFGSGAAWELAVGDTVELAPGDVREISGFEVFVVDAEEARLNDRREFLVTAHFTDQESALLRLALPPAPVPGLPYAAPLLAGLLASLLLGARRALSATP